MVNEGRPKRWSGIFIAILGILFLSTQVLRAAPPKEDATTMASPSESSQKQKRGHQVKNVTELRLYDKNGDSHVFEIEELPPEAGSGRRGSLQISPVASGTYSTDTDYFLIEPQTGAVLFGGKGPVNLRGSKLSGIKQLHLQDRNKDGQHYHFREASGGLFDGALGLIAGKTAVLLADTQGRVGFIQDVFIRGELGGDGFPVQLGEPLHAQGHSLTGLKENPCATCAVRVDFLDQNADGRVDSADSVQSLDKTVGCRSGQLCSRTVSVRVPAGETKRINFERAYVSGFPQLVQNPTFQPEGSADRLPSLSIESVERNDDGAVTGVVIRNGDADTVHTGSVGIHGVVE